MYSDKLIDNYLKSIEQKYNAVCFDIDGTITERQSKTIDERIIPVIADLLKKHIPIAFITGRGETGLNSLKNQILDKLRNQYNVADKDLIKMFALINDGARIFMTSGKTDEIFDLNEYIATKDSLKELREFDEVVTKLFSNAINSKKMDISYSKDLNTNIITNIRIKINSEDKLICDQLINIVNQAIKKMNYKRLNITTGIYENSQIIQIGTTIKSKAIEIAETIIGIPQNSMLIIGDCGNSNGNDYSMLDCSQGFSVDKVSGKDDKCFPIFDLNRNVLSGVDATLELLNRVKLLPTICLEHACEKEYTKAYSMIENEMRLGRDKAIRVFNSNINNSFDLFDGIYELFDKNSGSIRIPMYQLALLDDESCLKKFWLNKTDSDLCFSMFDNDSLLLRGSQTYYYFLSHRTHDDSSNKDIMPKSVVENWLNNYNSFFTMSRDMISSEKNCDDIIKKKMILGILDNQRNYLLILLNKMIVDKCNNKNCIINLDIINEKLLISEIYKNLLETDKIMATVCFNNKKIVDLSINDCLNKTITICNDFSNYFGKQNEKADYSKDFRVYREIDNFAENFITCCLTLNNIENSEKKGYCGLSYGGIELPIIMKLFSNDISDVSILNFNKNVTGYVKKQSVDLRFFDINKLGGLVTDGIDTSKKYCLLDDNLLTGKTMQLALSALYDTNIDVDKIMIVKYPSVNRINQMFLPNHGAVDYRYFFNFIVGLYFPSPYSWRDPHSDDLYEDSLGIFDLNRRKILECLVKNGDYAKQSEVEMIKKKVLK